MNKKKAFLTPIISQKAKRKKKSGISMNYYILPLHLRSKGNEGMI